jgi:hypothetical protein
MRASRAKTLPPERCEILGKSPVAGDETFKDVYLGAALLQTRRISTVSDCADDAKTGANRAIVVSQHDS